jgi:hypothetical protein
LSQNIRETGRRRARVAAVAIGTSSVLGAAALAAAVYAPSAIQNVSDTSGSSGGSISSDSNGAQQYQPSHHGLQSSRGGGAFGHSSGS